jgi:hypothetical protein
MSAGWELWEVAMRYFVSLEADGIMWGDKASKGTEFAADCT